MHMQVIDFSESNHLLSDVQFGFRSGKNTNQAIFNFLDNIYQNINNNIDTISVYIDFRKAFDTVHHAILLNKLKRLYFSTPAISLFESYLKDRTQQVFVNNLLSPKKAILTGVPQGSTLGPLLFVLYINDLPLLFNNSKCLLFADDTVIFHPVTHEFNTSYELMQTELHKLQLWCRFNLLEVNAGKN